jgi:hypothetical protein
MCAKLEVTKQRVSDMELLKDDVLRRTNAIGKACDALMHEKNCAQVGYSPSVGAVYLTETNR